jgi:hypothetical protein
MTVDRMGSQAWVTRRQKQLLDKLGRGKELNLAISDVIEEDKDVSAWERPKQKEALRNLVSEALRSEASLHDTSEVKQADEEFLQKFSENSLRPITDQERTCDAYIGLLTGKLGIDRTRRAVQRLDTKPAA